MSNWELFTLEGGTGIPKMTIRKGGQIGLNSSAVTKYGLSEYNSVLLHINKEEQKIGIKPTNDEHAKGARKFRIIQGGVTIPAKNFIDYYGLNDIKERRLNCEWNEDEKMIIAKYLIE